MPPARARRHSLPSAAAPLRWRLLLACALPCARSFSLELTDWQLAAEADLPADQRSGAALTAAGFAPAGAAWSPARVPCTVVACLQQAGRLPADLFVGDAIARVNASAFDGAWWFFSAFSGLPAAGAGGADAQASLTLEGINYRADVWLNGQLIAGAGAVAGAYAQHDLPLGGAAARGGGPAANRLALRLTRQRDQALGPGASATVDLGVTFVDWSFADPPDGNLGIWRKVVVYTHGAVTLRSPAVLTALPPPSARRAAAVEGAAAAPLDFPSANLTVVIEARNFAGAAFTGTLSGAVLPPPGGGSTPLCVFANVPVSVAAGAEATLRVGPDDVPCLRVPTPALWWPWQMGAPTLHALNLTLHAADGGLSDALALVPFGIRTASSALTAASLRLFSFNTLPFLVRGGGWSPDLFLRVDAARLDAQLALARDLHLNAVRFEGKMEPDEVFEALDQLGIVQLPGWCCCDAWQHWPAWQSEQRVVAAASMRTQARRLRRFAGMLGFLVSSDQLPPRDVEQLYLDELSAASWPEYAATVSAASDATSPITGKTGVKMSGPYSWVPPSYWLADTGDKGVGGAWGFLTEGGPGETPMTAESILATLPTNASAWPPAPTSAWGKAGNPEGNFGTLDRFNMPLTARYGPTTGTGAAALSDYLAKAAAASLEGHKAFLEAYSRRKYANATGVVQWMLNNDAPSNIWHLFHHDLTVGSAGAAAKQAMAPLHIAYDYSARAVYVVNSLYAPAPTMALTARIEVFDLADADIFSAETPLTAGAIAADAVLDLPALLPPAPAAGAGAYFLRLSLVGAGSALVDSNTYWLPDPQHDDVIAWRNSTWYNTPCSSFADLSALFSTLRPPARSDVRVAASFAAVAPADIVSDGARWLAGRTAGAWTRATVAVTNDGAGIAWLIRLRVLDGRNGSDPAPVFWADNFLVLRAGEARTVIAEFPDAILSSPPSIAWSFGGGGDTH